MSLAKHKTALGFFSLLALGLLLFGITALGGGKLFKHDTQFVLYFGSSVSGLSAACRSDPSRISALWPTPTSPT